MASLKKAYEDVGTCRKRALAKFDA